MYDYKRVDTSSSDLSENFLDYLILDSVFSLLKSHRNNKEKETILKKTCLAGFQQHHFDAETILFIYLYGAN